MSDELMRPIHLREVFKTKVWGGRRLESVLHKSLPPGEPIGESWEMSDHDHGMSVVDEGVFEGRTLRQLVESHGEALLGRPDALEVGGRFPLLFKFLDATDWLSVQVHPDDVYAGEHERGEAGKTEAWYVIHAEPGAQLARGLVPGMDRVKLTGAVDGGTVSETLRYVDVHRGDVVSMPAGTVHALGPGIVIAEIQQNSDTTYRVFDWGRVGLDGKPRELHVQPALDVIDFDSDDEPKEIPTVISEGHVLHERLLSNEKFTFDGYTGSTTFEIRPAAVRSFVILVCIDGSATLEAPGGSRPITCGRTLLLPGCLEHVAVSPGERIELLAMTLPQQGGLS